MGEDTIVEIAKRLDAGDTVKDLRDMRGVAYAMGASETPPDDAIVLPSFEQVRDDKMEFAEATKIIHNETNPYNARRLVQYHDRQAVVCNSPPLPIAQPIMDKIYGLPYTRQAHPSYKEPVPAYEMIKDSVTIMRGCFGGCTFCSITTHQGRIIQSRSKESVMSEIKTMTKSDDFKGVISDIGGPTANMYEMTCSKPEVEAVCRRQSCVHPTICKLLGTDHGPLIDLMKEARETPGVRKVFVASGIRMDLARRSPEYMRDLVRNHVGGHLKVAPEHTDPGVLDRMRKPSNDDFEEFTKTFNKESRKAGKEAIHRSVLHRQPSWQRHRCDDSLSCFPEAKRLQARPSARFHSGSIRRGNGDVPYGCRPVHEKTCVHRQAPSRSQVATSVDAIL